MYNDVTQYNFISNPEAKFYMLFRIIYSVIVAYDWKQFLCFYYHTTHSKRSIMCHQVDLFGVIINILWRVERERERVEEAWRSDHSNFLHTSFSSETIVHLKKEKLTCLLKFFKFQLTLPLFVFCFRLSFYLYFYFLI